MTAGNVINLISQNQDFITGFWVGVPLGLCFGISLFCVVDDLTSYIFRKIDALKERKRYERFDN